MSHKTRTRQGATFVREAYKEAGGNLEGYTLIKQDANNKAYKNNATGAINVGIRGTSNLSDVITDVGHAVGVNISTTDRYKDSKKFLEDLKRQNPTANLNVYGHSLGGTIVNKLAKENPQLISSGEAFNPYALKGSDLDSGGKIKNYRTKADVASALGAINNNIESVGSIFDIAKSITDNHSLSNFYKNGGRIRLMPIDEKLLSYDM
jgi:dienelactone hydrolase